MRSLLQPSLPFLSSMDSADPAGQSIFTFKYNDAGQVRSIGAAIPTVCIVVAGLRFLTRILQRTKLGVDEWLSLGSLVGLQNAWEDNYRAYECLVIDFCHRNGRMLDLRSVSPERHQNKADGNL